MKPLQKQLMNQYPYMKCGNNVEFKQRLQWLSEGMLKNQIEGIIDYKIDQSEKDMYNEYCLKRDSNK
jgi:hypothetical protein